MDFIEAMRCVKEGKKITRPSWPKDDYAAMENGFLSLRLNNVFHGWTVSEADVYANDWSIFPILFTKFEPRGADENTAVSPEIPA